MASNDAQQPLELFTVHSKSSHIRSNDVFTEISVHLDDDRTREPSSGHHKVVASRANLHAAGELADVTQLLPGTRFTP